METTHSGKHDADATFAYQIIQTDRTFTYDDAGKLLSATETEDNYGTYVYTYEYDLMGNRTAIVKTDDAGEVLESRTYTYNDSNQLTEVELYNGKKTTTVSYEYDADGNLISETGKDGTDKVELTYTYTVENRLEAVYGGKELLMAAAYDGDGNRVFQLNYNLHTDEDWKGNNGNGNGSNKDNSGSGNSRSSSSSDTTTEDTTTGDSSSSSSSNSNGNNGNGNGNNKNKTKNGNSSANNDKGGNGKNTTTTTTTTTVGETAETEESAETTTDSTSTGNGNATNAETNNSQNQSGIDANLFAMFPIDSETGDTEEYLIGLIKTTGKEKNYELIEYINDVNREYTEVLVEQNINGADDTTYVYGVDRLSADRFDGSTGYYLYDPRGSVTGITNEEGQIYQSYRYNANGEITFGAPEYENEYTYNGESYNPNIESQYLRARYYDVTTAAFITEDSYLGDIAEPLTLNRYNYCVSSPLNYKDKGGNTPAPIGIHPNEDILNIAASAAMDLDESVYDLSKKVLDEDYVAMKVQEKALANEQFMNQVGEFLTFDSVGQGIAIAYSTLTLPITGLFVLYRNWQYEKNYGETRDPWYDTFDVNNGVLEGLAGSGYNTYQYISNPEYLFWDLVYIVQNPNETIFSDPLAPFDQMSTAFMQGENEAPARFAGRLIGDVAQIAAAYKAVKTCASYVKKPAAASSGYTSIDEGLNFSNRAAEHMGESSRYVPVQTLQEAIKYGDAMPDPRGSSATMFYDTMYKNGGMYNLEVLYDTGTNTVYHFKYTRSAIGNLPAIK